MSKTETSYSKKCTVCGNSDGIRACAGCKGVHYCSTACQRADWKSHKPKCAELRDKYLHAALDSNVSSRIILEGPQLPCILCKQPVAKKFAACDVFVHFACACPMHKSCLLKHVQKSNFKKDFFLHCPGCQSYLSGPEVMGRLDMPIPGNSSKSKAWYLQEPQAVVEMCMGYVFQIYEQEVHHRDGTMEDERKFIKENVQKCVDAGQADDCYESLRKLTRMCGSNTLAFTEKDVDNFQSAMVATIIPFLMPGGENPSRRSSAMAGYIPRWVMTLFSRQQA